MNVEIFISKYNIERIILGIGIAFIFIIFLLFGKIHVLIFVFVLIIGYKLFDYYILTLNKPGQSLKCWPNLIIYFDRVKESKIELRRKQSANCEYIKRNPWERLMIPKRLDASIQRFFTLCLRDYIYSWLPKITQDDSFVYELKHLIRYFLATVIRRLENVNINDFITERMFPLIFQTCDRYIRTNERVSFEDAEEFLRQMYNDDLHIAMYNRQNEIKYLKRLTDDLLKIITPEYVSECPSSTNFFRELLVCQILATSFDALCDPNTLNRLFHLYFTNLVKPRRIRQEHFDGNVEILKYLCSMNGSIHKNKLSIDLKSVINKKEVVNNLIALFNPYGCADLLQIYSTLSDILNEIPLISNIIVREKIYQRLKQIDENYLNVSDKNSYIPISNPYDDNDYRLLNDIKRFIYEDLEESLNDENKHKSFNAQKLLPLLSEFHCKIFELILEKYPHEILTSDRHYLYLCGPRMDSDNYRILKQTFDEIGSDFIHIEQPSSQSENNNQQNTSKTYTTGLYEEMEHENDSDLKGSEDTISVHSVLVDERNLSTWRVRIDSIEELSESQNSSSKYAVFIIVVHRFDSSNDTRSINDEAKPHWIVARRYQDFYLLEQKLTEFHGIFSDARLPPRRSFPAARNYEILQSVKNDFEHFLRHLLSNPTLRNSELIYNFLTQPTDFTLPNGEIIFSKMFKVVPRRLRIEKGQYLEPFLISLLNYTEPAKSKSSQSIPVFHDIVERKFRNSKYGNNADISDPFFEAALDNTNENTSDIYHYSTYDNLIYIAKNVFSSSSFVIHLLNIFRIPLKNTFDAYFNYYIETKMDELLSDEDNIINVIKALQDIIFPADAIDKQPIDLVSFDDVIVAAEESIPNFIKTILGRSHVEKGLQILLQHFQNPLLNKQIFYMILDEIVVKLFPELELNSNASRTSTKT